MTGRIDRNVFLVEDRERIEFSFDPIYSTQCYLKLSILDLSGILSVTFRRDLGGGGSHPHFQLILAAVLWLCVASHCATTDRKHFTSEFWKWKLLRCLFQTQYFSHDMRPCSSEKVVEHMWSQLHVDDIPRLGSSAMFKESVLLSSDPLRFIVRSIIDSCKVKFKLKWLLRNITSQTFLAFILETNYVTIQQNRNTLLTLLYKQWLGILYNSPIVLLIVGMFNDTIST